MTKDRISILSKASKADVKTAPYPHLVIENALDLDIFEQLNEEYPVPSVVLNQREAKDTWFDYPACLATQNEKITPLWQRFMAYHTSDDFLEDVVSLFSEEIKQLYPDLELRLSKSLENMSSSQRQPGAAENPANHASDVSLECQYYINYTTQARAIRGPHIDRPSELYAALLYFRSEDDKSSGGDLQICEAKQPDELFPSQHEVKADHLPMEIEDSKINVVHTAKYKANTLVLFINSEKSVHAVSQRSATDIPRKHINFTADLFNLDDGGLFHVQLPASKKFKQWLEKKPGVWRLASLIPS